MRPVHVCPNGGEARRLFASNLSDGGMFIRTPKPLPLGTSLNLSLEAAGRALPFARAEVVFELKEDLAQKLGCLPGFGVRFTELQPKSRALVQHLLARCPVAPSEAAVPFPSAQLLGTPVDPFGPTTRTPSSVGRARARRWVRRVLGGTAVLAASAALAAYVLWLQQPEVLRIPFRSATVAAAATPGAKAARRATREAGSANAEAPRPASARVAEEPRRANESVAAQTAEENAAKTAALAPGIAPSQPARGATVTPLPPAMLELSPPTGAVSEMRFDGDKRQLVARMGLRERAEIVRSFSLQSPARLIVDVKGESPRSSLKLGGAGHVRQVRVLARPGGTRLVVALERAPERLRREGDTITLFYPPER